MYCSRICSGLIMCILLFKWTIIILSSVHSKWRRCGEMQGGLWTPCSMLATSSQQEASPLAGLLISQRKWCLTSLPPPPHSQTSCPPRCLHLKLARSTQVTFTSYIILLWTQHFICNLNNSLITFAAHFSHVVQILLAYLTRRAPLRSSSPPTVTMIPVVPRVHVSWTSCPPHHSHPLHLWSLVASCVVMEAAQEEDYVLAGVGMEGEY